MQTNDEINTSFFARITQLIDYYKFKNVNDFAINGLGYASGEKINRLNRGKGKPSVDILLDITNKFVSINGDWLLTGKGEMLKSNTPVAIPTHSKEGIPLIPVEAMAGFSTGDCQVCDHEVDRYVIPHFKNLSIDFMIHVRGSSMQPKYNSGDVVACKKLNLDTFFQWNKVYVLDTSQGPLIKRVKKSEQKECVLCVSDNKSYDPFDLPLKEVRALAIVLGVIRIE